MGLPTTYKEQPHASGFRQVLPPLPGHLPVRSLAISRSDLNIFPSLQRLWIQKVWVFSQDNTE